MAGVAFTIFRFAFSTLPFLAVLIYLLYNATQRTNDADNDDPFSLMDTSIVFLTCHVIWTFFAIYLLVFVPKRRRLLGRYLSEGETTLGDVVFDQSIKKRFGFLSKLYCCRSFRDYGYAIYPHPTKTDPPKVVRKSVRVYQPYTRERITILRLPGRPLSGQSKIDIEIDLSQMRDERDTTLKSIAAVSIFWVLFSLAGAVYCTYQMSTINDEYLVSNENEKFARRMFLVVVGSNPFAAYVGNSIRFSMYKKSMVNHGAVIENDVDARKIKHWCLYGNDDVSTDASDEIPYSIYGEDRSYAGTLPSHNRSVNNPNNNDNNTATAGASVSSGAASSDKKSHLTVSTVEEEGSAMRILPWTST